MSPSSRPDSWPRPWHRTSRGWRHFWKPRFVLPNRRQHGLTRAIHFGAGILPILMTAGRTLLGRDRQIRSEPKNILFVGRHHLGDVLMTLPALRFARSQLPAAKMTLVVQEKYRHQLGLAEIGFETTPEIEGLSFWEELCAWQHRFRSGNYDAIVFHRLTRPDFPAVVAAYLENIPHRMGGAEKGLQAFLTDLYCPTGRELVVNYHWNLVGAWLRRPASNADLRWPQIFCPAASPKQWDLLLAPFAQHTKEWPTESWRELMTTARSQGLSLALSAAPGQADRATALLQGFPEVKNLSLESRTLQDLFEHVGRSCCIVAVDTGIRHVAAAMKTPCVVLGHGREHYKLFGAYLPTERYLFFPVPCAPCGAEPCPLGHLQCIRGITTAEVLAAIDDLNPGFPRIPSATPSHGIQ